jgi:hypothetical protein
MSAGDHGSALVGDATAEGCGGLGGGKVIGGGKENTSAERYPKPSDFHVDLGEEA